MKPIGKRKYISGHPLFFLCLPLNTFPDIGSVSWIEKQKNLKKNQKKSRNSRPWYPRTMLKVNIHIFGLTKCTIYCKNVPVFLYAVTMLIFQIKRIISSEKCCNYIVTFFSFENAKNLGWSDDGKGRKKKRMG